MQQTRGWLSPTPRGSHATKSNAVNILVGIDVAYSFARDIPEIPGPPGLKVKAPIRLGDVVRWITTAIWAFAGLARLSQSSGTVSVPHS